MKQSCWRYSRSIFNEVSEFGVYVLPSVRIQTIYAGLNDQRPAVYSLNYNTWQHVVKEI